MPKVQGWQGVVRIGSRTVWVGPAVLDKGTAEYDANRAANMYRDRHEGTGKVAKRKHGVRRATVNVAKGKS